MDLIGYASFSVPVLGEFLDLVWAPLSSVIFVISFGSWKGILGGIGNFIEEFLPGTDFIPSFTIMWLIQNAKRKDEKKLDLRRS
jgi:hypothetical protein